MTTRSRKDFSPAPLLLCAAASREVLLLLLLSASSAAGGYLDAIGRLCRPSRSGTRPHTLRIRRANSVLMLRLMRVLLTRPRFVLSKEGASDHPKLSPQAKCPWLFGLNWVGQYFIMHTPPSRGRRYRRPHRARSHLKKAALLTWAVLEVARWALHPLLLLPESSRWRARHSPSSRLPSGVGVVRRDGRTVHRSCSPTFKL